MEYQFPIPLQDTEYVTLVSDEQQKKIPVKTEYGNVEWRMEKFSKKMLQIQHPLAAMDFKILHKDAVEQKYVLVVNITKKIAFPVFKSIFEQKYVVGMDKEDGPAKEVPKEKASEQPQAPTKPPVSKAKPPVSKAKPQKKKKSSKKKS